MVGWFDENTVAVHDKIVTSFGRQSLLHWAITTLMEMWTTSVGIKSKWIVYFIRSQKSDPSSFQGYCVIFTDGFNNLIQHGNRISRKHLVYWWETF